MKKKILSLMLMVSLAASLAACGQDSGKNSNSTDLSKTETEASSGQTGEAETTLVYGSADYTRINPAMDEHGEINLLLFNGLTAHDADDNIVPGLAEKWEYDAETCTYTFHIRDGIQWHDGEKFTADDVKFTIEAIMDPENGSENAPNYEDVEEITVIDDSTVSFRLSEPNVAFLEYMTMAILPKHLLEGENMQESDFFRAPVGTGPYKLESWDEGQSIVLVKNEDYYLGAPKIDKVIFKIVPDDNAQAMQLESGELDLALLDPKNAQNIICFSVSDPIQHFPNIPFNAHRSVTDQIRDTHIAGVDADIKIIFIFCCHAEKWIFDDSRRVVSHAEFQIQDMASVVTKQEIDASAGCLMPAFIFHKRVIRAQIHAHRFSAVWAVRHQF